MAVRKEVPVEDGVVKHRLQNNVHITRLAEIEQASGALYRTWPLVGIISYIDLIDGGLIGRSFVNTYWMLGSFSRYYS